MFERNISIVDHSPPWDFHLGVMKAHFQRVLLHHGDVQSFLQVRNFARTLLTHRFHVHFTRLLHLLQPTAHRHNRHSTLHVDNKQSMDCGAQLAWKCLFTLIVLRRATSTSKISQTDLVFGVRSGFISRSVHAILQVSVCSGYNLCHPG